MKVPPKGRNEVAAVLRGVMTGGTRVQAAHDWIGNNQLDTAGAKLMGEAAGRLTELDLSPARPGQSYLHFCLETPVATEKAERGGK